MTEREVTAFMDFLGSLAGISDLLFQIASFLFGGYCNFNLQLQFMKILYGYKTNLSAVKLYCCRKDKEINQLFERMHEDFDLYNILTNIAEKKQQEESRVVSD